ncbi:MAG TPA: molybdopterin-dependent oxidoreductase [Bryobacterales bacterium]|nr:molybdopterin-dependent oxidoreductase [Bryobacterales bacterium]
MDRRDFFKIFSTASAGLMTGACGKKLDTYIPLLVPDQEIVPGAEQWYPALCGECPSGCGVIVRVMESERVIERNGEKFRQKIAAVKKIEGNPLDSVSGGRLCARGQAGVQSLYNPDRLRGPMHRKGPRGQADFIATSWDEAIAVAAEKLDRVRQENPSQIVFLTGPQPGARALAIARFLESLGAPPPACFELVDFPLERKAAEQVYGWDGLPVYDLSNARYALGIGADFLGGWTSPVFYARQFGHFRQGRSAVRGRLVQAQSRFSITAQSADEWTPLLPGSELSFALAIGHLLLSEKMARQPEELPDPVRQTFESVDPASAARACGLDERRVRRLARELGESEAPLVISGASAPQTNSLAALVAAAYLNVMLGNVGRPGGVWPPAPGAVENRAAFSNAIPLLERAQYLFLDGSNPVYTLPASAGIAEKLGRIPTSVSFSPFLDDSAAYVDLLLPDHHPLEASNVVFPLIAPGPAVVVTTQFVQPLYDTRATEQVLAAIAAKMGLSFQPAPPRSVAERILPQGQSWDDVVEQGGFWGEPGSDSSPGSRPARSRASSPTANAAGPVIDSTPAVFSGEAAQFPLYFQPYLSLQFQDGRGANLPWMQELPDPVSSAMWGLPVEIDTRTAASLGIQNGDLVRVESPHGHIDAPAYVHPAAIPGVVSMAIGGGHKCYGRYAGRGSNPLSILAPVWEKTTGALALGATRVRLSKLGPERQLIQFSANDREQGPWGYR